jgi:hypothetical protein
MEKSKNNTETSGIGLILYNLMTGEYKITQQLKTILLKQYHIFQSGSRKEKIKDIIFILSTITVWAFMLWVVQNKDDFITTHIRYPNGASLSGNCEFIKEKYYEAQGEFRLTHEQFAQMNQTQPEHTNLVELCPIITCPELTCPPIPEMKCPACPETPTCPVCVEKECPPCRQESIGCDAILAYANSQRPPLDNPAFQKGWFDFRKLVQTFCGGEVAMFDESPGVGITPNILYGFGSTTPKNPGHFTFNIFTQYGRECFNITRYPDEFDRKRWTWDDNQCKSSVLTLCKI